MSNPSGNPNVYTKTDLTYNDYLKIPELLSLQIPESNPPHHDETLFIIIHQAYELWFKQILHELESARKVMTEPNVLKAHHYVRRTVQIMRLLVQQIHILETMTPADFLVFRDRLNPASGFQSLQFRELEFLMGLKEPSYFHYFKNRPEMIQKLETRMKEPDIRQTYYVMLRKLGFKIPENAAEIETSGTDEQKEQVLNVLADLYRKPDSNLPVYLLTESLVDLDQQLILWRTHHVRVVERIIGFKRGTGGSSGVGYLQNTLSKKCFPLVWDVRTRL